MLALMAIPGIGILIPLNYTGDNGSTGFESLSLSNITSQSNSIYGHLFVCYYCCIVCYYYLHKMWKFYQSLRHSFLRKEAERNKRLTIMIHSIPSTIHNDKDLFDQFNVWFPSHVVNAYMARDTIKLRELITERDVVVANLERANIEWEDEQKKKGDKAERITVRTKYFLFGKCDAIEHYGQEIDRLNTAITALQNSPDSIHTLHSGFVTFDSAVVVATAIQVDKTDAPIMWDCKLSPEPSDIDYDRLTLDYKQRYTKSVLADVATFALAIFWIIPVSAVQGVANLSGIASEVTWLQPVLNVSPVITGIIEGYVPTVILILFNFLLPAILVEFAKFGGIESRSWQQMSLFTRFFIFQIFNNFVATLATGSIFDQLSTYINDVPGIPLIIGDAIPNLGTFFVTIILLGAFTVLPLQQLNIGALIGYKVQLKFLVKTQREGDALHVPFEMFYGKFWPVHIFIFILAINYCVIAPIVVPFACCYFAVGYMVNKYNLLYAYTNIHYESGGAFWPIVFDAMMVSLILAQVFVIFVFGLKEVAGASVLLLPLPFVSWWFHRLMYSYYYDKSIILPLDAAVTIDNSLKEKGIHGIAQKLKQYIQGDTGGTTSNTDPSFEYKELPDTTPLSHAVTFGAMRSRHLQAVCKQENLQFPPEIFIQSAELSATAVDVSAVGAPRWKGIEGKAGEEQKDPGKSAHIDIIIPPINRAGGKTPPPIPATAPTVPSVTTPRTVVDPSPIASSVQEELKETMLLIDKPSMESKPTKE